MICNAAAVRRSRFVSPRQPTRARISMPLGFPHLNHRWRINVIGVMNMPPCLALRLCQAAGLFLIFAASTGCPEKKPAGQNAKLDVQSPLVLLVVDDPQLGETVARE